jgi:hypothetical protein
VRLSGEQRATASGSGLAAAWAAATAEARGEATAGESALSSAAYERARSVANEFGEQADVQKGRSILQLLSKLELHLLAMLEDPVTQRRRVDQHIFPQSRRAPRNLI